MCKLLKKQNISTLLSKKRIKYKIMYSINIYSKNFSVHTCLHTYTLERVFFRHIEMAKLIVFICSKTILRYLLVVDLDFCDCVIRICFFPRLKIKIFIVWWRENKLWNKRPGINLCKTFFILFKHQAKT